jgi:ketosteroid isomerase-like protein
MRRLIIVSTLFVVSLVLSTATRADDMADAKAAVLAVDAAYSSGDVEAIARYMHPEHSQFLAGGLLVEGFDKEVLNAAFDAGLNVDITARHLGVKIYGNTAVATGYIEGQITSPDGTVNQLVQRFSEIWVKEGGKWKRVHIHQSPLSGQQ